MASKEHGFSPAIRSILTNELGSVTAADVFANSPLIEYINIKTASASKGSKSRGSFANLYAIYVLVEDYLKRGFGERGGYSNSNGAKFSALFARQRELPFGDKLQNHALNSRLNEEYRKYFPATEMVPIIRDLSSSRYWFDERLLLWNSNGHVVNLAKSVLTIIDEYVRAKRDSFQQFLDTCKRLLSSTENEIKSNEPVAFVESLLAPNVDARIFEIVSFSIMKAHYGEQSVWFGWARDEVAEEALVLYKTGRTNANDGGIDFVMRPLGRFYQVTETLDLRKYFLDIEKVQRFPITFVVKTELSVADLQASIRQHAARVFPISSVAESYVSAVEEIINLPILRKYLTTLKVARRFDEVLLEMATQARVEFNLNEDEEAIASASSS